MVSGKYGLGFREVAVVAFEVGGVEVRVVASLAELAADLQPLRALVAAEFVPSARALARGVEALLPAHRVGDIDALRPGDEESP